MKLASQVPALGLLDFEQSARKGLQPVRGFAQGLLGPLALGDVTVDRIDLNLSAGERDRHTDHRNVQTAAILALANALHIHALPVRHQVRVSLLLISRLVGYNQVAQAAAEGLLRTCSQKSE